MTPEQESVKSESREAIQARRVGWWVIAAFLGISSAMFVLVPILGRSAPFDSLMAGPAWRSNAVVFASLLLIAVGGVMFGLGKLQAADLGLRRDKLREGVVVTVIVWAVMQGVEAVMDLLLTGTVSLAPGWQRDGFAATLVWTATMFLGAGLYEEIAYRGFLFPQLYLRVGGSHRARFGWALIASQLVFAVSHIPAHVAVRSLSGSGLWTTVLLQGFVGAMLVLVYTRTRNLWIAVGLHGLANAPTPLVSGAGGFEVYLILLIVGWPWLTRRSTTHRGFASVEPIAAVQPVTLKSDPALP